MENILYYNVEGLGFVAHVDKPKHLFITPSFVMHTIYTYDALLNRMKFVTIYIEPRTFEEIIPPPNKCIVNISVDAFKDLYLIELKRGHWEPHHKDRLMISDRVRGSCLCDKNIFIKSYTHHNFYEMDLIRPISVTLKYPERVAWLGVETDDLSGRWEYHDSVYNCDKMPQRIYRHRNTLYFYVDVAIGDKYFILKVQSNNMLIVDIKEYHNVDNTRFREHVVKNSRSGDLNLDAMNEYFAHRMRDTGMLSETFADLMHQRRNQRSAALLCDVDIVFTA